ncbi:hypothetical protein [Coprobacillus sp. AF33-1AC]|uniref:phage tail protein n=1 Tax=Coprobacillus sp. AF33-1AC TaxID=2292032 RepID=UPI000E53C428|nr:hypothetical protein [Coprobacillus sp. AF33-1AC]RHM59652.1 hypothetical protein DWZ53_08895 [Coprobacillus sp. AF33-1AC]
MATELGKAFVQIVPSAKGIKGALENQMGPEASAAGESAGHSLVSTIKKVIVAAGIGKVVSASFTEGAALEQSLGGIETLYKASADKMKAYAKEAYKTSGVSANTYMENVTSFSASLISSLKGDTSKAADIANRAMQDMSDNSNKFGTNIQDIQNAYQGFAKQNYTMLDNLKLGYGGTKEEMQRLLKDAQKLSGQKYDISNLADVYTAIGVIQDNLDITGTTAKEAATTFSGSFGSMKAAAQDLLGNIAIGGDIQGSVKNLLDTTSTFIFKNAIPMAGNITKGLISALISGLPQMYSAGKEMISNFIKGFASDNSYTANISKVIQQFAITISNELPKILKLGGQLLQAVIPVVGSVINGIVTGFLNSIPLLIQTGYDFLNSIINGFKNAIPEALPQILQFVQNIADELAADAPILVNKGFDLLNNLVDGIISAIPILIEYVPTIVSTFANIINDNAPTILQKGVELIWHLITGLIQAIPTLIANIPQIINAIVSTLMAFQWISIGKNIISFFSNGITAMKENVVGSAKKIKDGIIKAFKDGFNGAKEAGENLVKGLWNGIKNVKDWILDKVKGFGKGILDGLKDFFGIHSPSRVMRDEIGKFLPEGMAVGIEANADAAYQAMDKLSQDTINIAKDGIDFNGNNVKTNNDMYSFMDIIIKLLKMILNKNEDTVINLNDREVARALKELGVVFE